MNVRAGASFSAEKEYRVHIKLGVRELDENEEQETGARSGDEEEEDAVQSSRGCAKHLVALEVIVALCECPAGLSGGCSHATMLLFLARLLTLTDAELATFNPSTCTGRACAWLQQHRNAGRSASKCPLYGKPLSEGVTYMRRLRNPRGEVHKDDATPVPTRGVPHVNRMQDFNPHPSGGVWAEREHYFTAGKDISRVKHDKLMGFVDAEMGSCDGDVGLDILPPIVRDDSNPEGLVG